MALTICPTCGGGIKQTRGWTWVDLAGLVAGTKCEAPEPYCSACPMSNPEQIGRAGLLWIGEQFYPTPAHFAREGEAMGISRRIRAIPRGFKLGETWVLLAHPKALPCRECSGLALAGDGEQCGACKGKGYVAGIFRVFKPQRIEKLITESQATPETLADMEKAGITPVVVPDNDKDHRGTVYDEEEEPALIQ